MKFDEAGDFATVLRKLHSAGASPAAFCGPVEGVNEAVARHRARRMTLS